MFLFVLDYNNDYGKHGKGTLQATAVFHQWAAFLSSCPRPSHGGIIEEEARPERLILISPKSHDCHSMFCFCLEDYFLDNHSGYCFTDQ
jgi:hypothetical protein